jgi:hypothetical protein
MSGEIRRAPDADGVVPAVSRSDDQAPSGGGAFRRIAPEGSALSGLVGIADMLYAPRREAARQEIQRQRHVGQDTPAPTDPPGEDTAAADEGRVAASGRRGTPFSGYIVLRPPG